MQKKYNIALHMTCSLPLKGVNTVRNASKRFVYILNCHICKIYKYNTLEILTIAYSRINQKLQP